MNIPTIDLTTHANEQDMNIVTPRQRLLKAQMLDVSFIEREENITTCNPLAGDLQTMLSYEV